MFSALQTFYVSYSFIMNIYIWIFLLRGFFDQLKQKTLELIYLVLIDLKEYYFEQKYFHRFSPAKKGSSLDYHPLFHILNFYQKYWVFQVLACEYKTAVIIKNLIELSCQNCRCNLEQWNFYIRAKNGKLFSHFARHTQLIRPTQIALYQIHADSRGGNTLWGLMSHTLRVASLCRLIVNKSERINNERLRLKQ